jgi:hypothetical protein
MDRHSLRDAIDAEHLAATLRARELFFTSQVRVDADTIRRYARARAEDVRHSLSGSDADVQWSFEQVESRWEKISRLQGSTRIVSLLARHARTLLQLEGSEVGLRVDIADPGREISRWRFVSLAIPPSILVAVATPYGTRPATSVRLLHRAMAPDVPVAHQHVHHAAMLSFEEVWGTLRVRALLRPGAYWNAFSEDRAFCPGLHRGRCLGARSAQERELAGKFPFARRKHLIEWAAMIRLAFFARGLLQRHLQHGGDLSNCGTCGVPRQVIAALIQGRVLEYREATRNYPWPDELVALRRRDREEERRPSHSGFPEQIAAEEQRFLVRAFDYVAPLATASPDDLFEKTLLQYLRVKAAVFGLLVHPPGEPGLERFLDHFLQIKVYMPAADQVAPRPVDEPGLRVEATEYRVAPDAWFRFRRQQEIERRGTASTAAGSRESGWLIHFKRKPAPRGVLPVHGPSIRSMDAEADQIMRYMEVEPQQLEKLRGIDICGVEEAQPCWVVADTLRRLRHRSEDIVARSRRRYLQPLRLSLHAGEDFQWLTTGVRAIAEPFVWNLLRRGDRIGHGIAITLDPKKWWQKKSRDVVNVKRFDCFLNLAFLAEYVPEATRDQREWLRESLIDIVRQLALDGGGTNGLRGGSDIVQTARRFWRSLGTPALRRIIATPSSGVAGEHRHLLWLHRYLWKRSVHERGDEKITRRLEGDRGSLAIASDHNELDLLTEARKRVIHDLARWQICIEANPTSNLVVGSLESMLAQDFLHRRPTVPAAHQGDETLLWTISTDDPITFSTTLADEYAYAWAGMVLRQDKPYDPAYARAVLDEAAATSMRTRFTIPFDAIRAGTNSRGRHRRP